MELEEIRKKLSDIQQESKKNKNSKVPFYLIKTIGGRYDFGTHAALVRDSLLHTEMLDVNPIEGSPPQFFPGDIEEIKDVDIKFISWMFLRLQKERDSLIDREDITGEKIERIHKKIDDVEVVAKG